MRNLNDLQSCRNFAQLVNNTSRKERKSLFGSSIVYSEEYDIEAVAAKVTKLLTLMDGYKDALTWVLTLIDEEKATAKERKQLIQKLNTYSVDDLKRLLE